MNGTEFLKTMIDVIKYDDHYNKQGFNKQELLAILRNSIITFNETGIFAIKSYYCWEDVDLRVPVPLLKEARKYKDVFEKIANDIYIPTGDFEFRNLRIMPKVIESQVGEIKEHDVYFSEIQDTIIQGIRNAKYLIWVAVAWFTDKTIYKELLEKQKEGVDIKIIISNDDGNRTLISELEDNFECIKVDKKGYWNNDIMHDKFCIIDLEYVMHGSYNWSKSAQTNEETLSTALDKDFVLKFADEFMRLYRENRR